MVVVGDEFNLPDASRLVKSITTPTYHEADELLPPEGRFTPDTQQLFKIYKKFYEKFTAIELSGNGDSKHLLEKRKNFFW
jgi:hypothetical protein